MNTLALDVTEIALESKRRLARKVKRRDCVVESVTFQRHRARVSQFLRARHAQNNQPYHEIASVDDVLVFDRLGNRILYPVAPVDQLARFKKG